jgi:plastocyanin
MLPVATAGTLDKGAVVRSALLVAGVVVGAAALAGCGDDSGTTVEVGTTVEGAPEVEVEARDFEFVPNPLELPAGEPVTLTMRVTGGGHNIRIEGAGYQTPIVEEGDAAVGTVTLPAPGEYRMVCTVPGHEAAGMVGTVVGT